METRYAGTWAVAAILLPITLTVRAAPEYPWRKHQTGSGSLAQRIPTPPGYERISVAGQTFASWLRGLPLRDARTVVRLFNGAEKSYQGGVFAVVDVDVGASDLQQCADAVIRLRAEYLWASGCAGKIAFDFASGHSARWLDWREGRRPVVSGNKVSWVPRSDPDSSYTSFREYLNSVFTYAGSFSLARELRPVADPSRVLPGDVFIRGGFPGHAVLVADVAHNDRDERLFLLLQSYMPAQDVHVLRSPMNRDSPWYPARKEGNLETPEWTFSYSELRRFHEPDCEAEDHGVMPPNNAIQRTERDAPRR